MFVALPLPCFHFFSPEEFPYARLQESLVLLNTLVCLSANIKRHLELYQIDVLCRLMECFTVTIDLQMKGIDIENDPVENLPKPYKLSDIAGMLPLFKELLSLVVNFMNKKLRTVYLERCSAAEWNRELQVSNF